MAFTSLHYPLVMLSCHMNGVIQCLVAASRWRCILCFVLTLADGGMGLFRALPAQSNKDV